MKNILQEADELFRLTLESISNTKINGSKWTQASLPISLGGLGIRRLQDLSEPAYWSSLYKSIDLSNSILRNFDLNLADICTPNDDTVKYIPEELECKKQQARSSALSSARIPSILEPPGLSRDDGKKPDGVTLIPWSHGKAIIWDTTVVNTLAKSYLYLSSKNAGSVAEAAERRKYNHYTALQNDYHFTPIAFETMGCMGPDTRFFLNHLGSLMKKETGEPRSLSFLLDKISICIQRGNAACILGTMGKKHVYNDL